MLPAACLLATFLLSISQCSQVCVGSTRMCVHTYIRPVYLYLDSSARQSLTIPYIIYPDAVHRSHHHNHRAASIKARLVITVVTKLPRPANYAVYMEL